MSLKLIVLLLGTGPRQPMNTVRAAQHLAQRNKNVANARADSVLGGLEDHPPCQHCLMGPCITVSEVTRIQGSCALDINNHSEHHKNYRKLNFGNLCPNVSLMAQGSAIPTHRVCHIGGKARAKLKHLSGIEGVGEGGRPFSTNCVLSWKISIIYPVDPLHRGSSRGEGLL